MVQCSARWRDCGFIADPDVADVTTQPMRPSTATPADASPATKVPVANVTALHFEGFSVCPSQRQLSVRGAPVKLGARAFDLLMVLVNARDRVVTKNELLDRVWPGLVVEENNLQVHVSTLRKHCGNHVIATVPGRGYQFTASSVAALSSGSSFASGDATGDSDQTGFSGGTPAGNLTATLTPLFGREREVVDVVQMLEQRRWVTITGAGGMGKTRLAQVVGESFQARLCTWLVELAAIADPRLVPNAVAQTLGATLIDVQNPVGALVAELAGRPVLLILDNCEHLVAAVGDLCVELLQELPLLRILVTSQEIIRSAEEYVFKLGPLDLPESTQLKLAERSGAIRLLVARVRAQLRQFELTDDNLGDAISICRQLDGLPLAIELAAARVPMLGLVGVRARLGELFRLLTGDARVRLRRHQTLRAAMDWSYQLLSKSEQALFRRLGVFAGSFSIEGVRHIASDLADNDWDVLDTLSSLIDKSLVQVRGSERPRYILLETTRAYAIEQLAQSGETNDALERHARATQCVCAKATKQRDTESIWHEIANVRAAFNWSIDNKLTELSIFLAIDSSVVLALGGLVGEVLERLLAVEPLVHNQLPTPLLAQYWQWLGRFGNDGRMPAFRCVKALETAEALFRDLRNHRHVHACLRMRAEALLELGDLDSAQQAIDSARQMESETQSVADRMRRLRIEGLVLDAQGQYVPALTRLEDALALARAADIHRYVLSLTQDIGQCHLNASNPVDAERCFREVLCDQRPDLSVGLALAYARIGLASALLAQGKLAEAYRNALESVAPLRSCGIFLGHAEVFAWLLASLQEHVSASIFLRASDTFRAFSQTARSPMELRAYSAAIEVLGDRLGAAPDMPGPSQMEVELAQLLRVPPAVLLDVIGPIG